jgi:DNA-binding NarL/FixJ family response regulator
MKRHLFLTERPQPIPRWIEAFPDALLLCGLEMGAMEPASLPEASIIWLHTIGDNRAVASWVRAIKTASQAPIVVLSNVPEDEQGLAALAAGASGYCSALTLPAVLHQVASVVAHGGTWVGPQLLQRLMQGLTIRANAANEPVLDKLSQRERQVAEEVARGLTNKEIARVMGITERTVKAHLSAAFEKLDVRDRMQLSLLVNHVENSNSTHAPQKIPA